MVMAKALGHRCQCGFGHTVQGMIGAGAQSPAGGDINDDGRLAFSKKGNGRPADSKRCFDIDGKRLPVIIVCGFRDRAAANDPGIVDNDVEAAKDSFGLFRESVAVGRVGKVTRQ